MKRLMSLSLPALLAALVFSAPAFAKKGKPGAGAPPPAGKPSGAAPAPGGALAPGGPAKNGKAPGMAPGKAPSGKKPGGKKPGGKAKAGGAATASVTGPVKGSVTGKTFVIGSRKGAVTVDASAAKIRDKGKFTKIDAIKGGVMVTAKGSMNGTTLKATEITVHSKKAGGGKAAGGKAAGAKGKPKAGAKAGASGNTKAGGAVTGGKPGPGGKPAGAPPKPGAPTPPAGKK